MTTHVLNARNMLCPLPVIRTQDAAAGLQSGECLEVYCTDHGALNDIPAWCRINGHELLEKEDLGTEVRLLIRVVNED